MPVSFRTVTPFFIGLMLIMIMPFVPVVMAIPDKFLTMLIAPEMIIIPAMLVIMQIRLRLIHHDLAAMIKIEIIVVRRQLARKTPVPAV